MWARGYGREFGLPEGAFLFPLSIHALTHLRNGGRDAGRDGERDPSLKTGNHGIVYEQGLDLFLLWSFHVVYVAANSSACFFAATYAALGAWFVQEVQHSGIQDPGKSRLYYCTVLYSTVCSGTGLAVFSRQRSGGCTIIIT